MDYQHRVGHKTGSGQPASAQDLALDRKERLRRLALETVDLSKDPYMLRNHVGKIECRLCLTLHLNESSYLTHTQVKNKTNIHLPSEYCIRGLQLYFAIAMWHTLECMCLYKCGLESMCQGRKHQTNLARRAAKERMDAGMYPTSLTSQMPKPAPVDKSTRIGRPGYRVTKMKHPETGQFALSFEINYKEIKEGLKPRHRFLSSWEQKVEPPDASFQYLAFAAEPYETIGNPPQDGDFVCEITQYLSMMTLLCSISDTKSGNR